MGEQDLNRKLEELTRRLERIERSLGIEGDEVHDPAVPKPSDHVTKSTTPSPTSDAPIEQQPGAQTESPPPLASRLAARKQEAADRAVHAREHAKKQHQQQEPQQPASPTSPVTQRTAPPPTPTPARFVAVDRDEKSSGGGLEVFLGIKAAAALGAIIVVLGTMFAIREYATGFWAALPTTVQALIIAAFGGALIATGELAARRIGKLGGIGLMSAGIGVLYLDAYATFQWFEPAVVTQNGSFALMAIVAAIGFALTVRTRSLFIGVLSLVLGYLTPLLLADADGPLLGLLAYLTMLFGIALGLAYARPTSFYAMRYAAIGGQGLLGVLALLTLGTGEWLMFFVFLSIWWAMLTAESLFAAIRDRTPIGNVIAALVGTGGYVTLGGWALAQAGTPATDWFAAFLGMVAVLNAAIALHFASGLDVLRTRPATAIDKLGVGLCAAAGVLIAAAIAFQFEGYGMSIAWLVLALVSIESGRRLPSPGVSVFGLTVLALALARLITVDALSPALASEVWTIDWLTMTHWALISLAAIAALVVAAVRLRVHRGKVHHAMPTVLLAAAALGWLAWCLWHAQDEAITAVWLLGSMALLASHKLLARQSAMEIGLLMLLATASKWLLLDAIADRLDPAWEAQAHMPVLNVQMGLAVAIAAVGFWAMRLVQARTAVAEARNDRASVDSWMQVVCVLAGVFFLIALSFEVDRVVLRLAQAEVEWSIGHVRQVMLTILWSLGGLGFGLLARTLTQPDSRARTQAPWLVGASWLILCITGLKWLVVDTLFWALELDRATLTNAVPLVNLQMLAGVMLAGIAMGLIHLRVVPQGDEAERPASGWRALGAWMPVCAALLILWGLTFEVDRWLMRRVEIGAELAWPFAQWRILWWVGLWSLGGLAMYLIGRWRAHHALISTGAVIAALTAGAWLTVGTLFWRLTEGAVAVPIIANVQFLTGALAVVAMTIMSRSQGGSGASSAADSPSAFEQSIVPALATLIALSMLWLGTLEVDRAFIEHEMARQMGWSVYWAIFGVALVLTGFRFRAGPARYAGLALLAMTVGKILIVDLATVAEIWRIVSFIVTGLLLIATSAAYVKWAPRLLERVEQSEDGQRAMTKTA